MSRVYSSPQISVIIPARNVEKFIGRAIRSILSQSISHNEFEVIVIEDASSDRTAFALDLFRDEIHILKNDAQQGLPACLNIGIKAARGKYIVRLDADDYVCKDYLFILRRFLEDNQDMDAVACDYFLVDDREMVLERRNCMAHPIGCGIMFRVDHLIDIGMYDDTFLMHEDRELMQRFSKKFSITRVALPLYRYRRHGDNMTNDEIAHKLYLDKLNSQNIIK